MPQGCGGASTPRSDPSKQTSASSTNNGTNSSSSSSFQPPPPAFPTAAIPESTPRRSWVAKEEWLGLEGFTNLLRSPPYDVIIGCDSWRPTSNLVFPGSRQGARAVQSVEVIAARRKGLEGEGSSGGSRLGGSGGDERAYRFTFCLERVEAGSMKGCWLTVGVRVGDYSL